MSRVTRWILLTVLIAAVGLGAYFYHKPTAAHVNATKAFIKESPPAGKVLIVFVHGVFGSGDSWLDSNNVSLPKLLAADPRVGPAADVLVYQYESPKITRAGEISDVAEGLGLFLDHKNVWKNYRKVIFVGHSMGGIVIRQYLIANHAHATQVPLIYLYATPTNGAEIATVGSTISHNQQLKGLFPVDGDNLYLDSVYSDWTNSPELQGIPTYCSFEGKDTFGIRIVSRSSASALCLKSTRQEADHLQIANPDGPEDPRYYVLQLKVLDVLTVQSSDGQEAVANAGKPTTPTQPQHSQRTVPTIEQPLPTMPAHNANVAIPPVLSDPQPSAAHNPNGQPAQIQAQPPSIAQTPPITRQPTTSTELTAELLVHSLRKHISSQRFPRSRDNVYWYIWLDLPESVRDQVQDATYTFDPDYIKYPIEATVKPSRGAAKFGASACDQSGRVVVELQNRSPVAADFNLCTVPLVNDYAAVPR